MITRLSALDHAARMNPTPLDTGFSLFIAIIPSILYEFSTRLYTHGVRVKLRVAYE